MIKKKRKKVVRRRRRKSIFSNLFFSFSLFSSIIIFSALGFLFFSPRFQIDNLVISGNNNLSTEEIERIANEKIKTSFSFMGIDIATESIFLSLGNKVSQIKDAMPEIERISIKRNFPDGISLEIIEKTPFVVWNYENQKFLVDKSGSFIRNIEESNIFSELLQINQEENIDFNKKEMINNILIIKDNLLKQGISISNYIIFNDRLRADTEKDFFILFNLKEELEWQIEKLKAVLERNEDIREGKGLKYIDLRFDNQAIIQK